MGKSQRVKGAVGEREVATIVRAAGFDVDRVPNSGGLKVKGDLIGLAGFHCEVKRQETLQLPKWSRQSETEAPTDDVPLVIYRRSHEPWRVSLPLGDFLKLVAAVEDSE